MTFTPDRYVAALRFAATKHEGQRMAGSDLPYLVHVVSVTSEVIAALCLHSGPGLDGDLAVTCALLHDTLEDTATTQAELVATFGHAVTDGVLALSKLDASIAKADQMANSLRRIRLQPREIWIVKLADRITNLAPPPEKWSSDKRRGYRDEAIQIADALAGASPVLDARIRARITGYSVHF
ncbi:MAG: HD domain-containing protein [Kofleriaceae bacterium]